MRARGLAMAVLLSAGLAPGAVEAASRLPDWVALGDDLATPSDAGLDAAFPSEEEQARWRRAGHGYVDLLWRIDIHVERSGRIASRAETVRHFLSESGIAQGGNMDLFADSWRDRLTIEWGFSRSPDGATVTISPDTIEVVPTQIVNVFSDWQRVILPIPGLQPGSNATIAGTRRFQSSDFPLAWSKLVTLGSVVPVKRVEISVTTEPGAPEIDWDTNDPGLECEAAPRRGLRCTRVALPAIAIDHDVTSYLELVPHFIVGFTESWTQLQSRVRALVEGATKTTPALRAQAASLGLDLEAPDEEKLWTLLRFVADEIRYVSLSHGDRSVVPHPAALTLERRFGDCKDKVALLVTLGRLSGLDLTPVLTSTERKDPASVLRPSSSYFDHMIACLPGDDGQRLCVDPTQAYSGLELPPLLGGAIALSLGADEPAVLGVLPGSEFGWEVALRRESRLEPGGTVVVHDVRQFSGPGAAVSRSEMLAVPQTDLQSWIQTEYKEAHGSSSAPDFAIEALSDASRPYEITSTTVSPGRWRAADGTFYGYDRWLSYYASSMTSANRHHPYRLVGLRYTAEETVSLCCGEIQHFGAALGFESRYGRLEREYQAVDGQIVVRTTFELPSAVIPVGEIPDLQAFVLQSLRESAMWISWPVP